jgi:AbiU2
MSDVTAKVEEGRRTTDRVVGEILAARKSWALFESFNGKDDAARAQLRASVSALGLVTCANGIAMALVRDTLLALFRISDAPGSDKLTLCRLSRSLQDPGVVARLEQDARRWSARMTPYSQKFADEDAATCRRAISLITTIVPPKWDANSPPSDPRLFNLRTKLKDVRDHVIAHSVDTSGVMFPHRNDIMEFLDLASELVEKAQLVFRGTSAQWEDDFKSRLKEATVFWDCCQQGLAAGSTH